MNIFNRIFQKFFLLLWFLILMHSAHSQKIGLLMDSYVNERWLLDQKFFTEKINQLGGEVQIEVANGDASTQLDLAKKLIDEGAKVLVVVPCDGKKANDIVALAKAAKVPVIAYDRLIMNNEIALYASYDNMIVGKLQAEYAFEKIPNGNYLLLNGPVSDNNAILFREAQMEALAPHIKQGAINIIGDIVLDSWSEIEAMMQLEEYFMKADKLPDVIIAANDILANASIEALKSNNIVKEIVVTGQDADLIGIKNILTNKQSMTIYKPIQPLAHLAAEAAWKLAKGEEILQHEKMKVNDLKINAVLLHPVVVNSMNYKETVVKDGHILLSDID